DLVIQIAVHAKEKLFQFLRVRRFVELQPLQTAARLDVESPAALPRLVQGPTAEHHQEEHAKQEVPTVTARVKYGQEKDACTTTHAESNETERGDQEWVAGTEAIPQPHPDDVRFNHGGAVQFGHLLGRKGDPGVLKGAAVLMRE